MSFWSTDIYIEIKQGETFVPFALAGRIEAGSTTRHTHRKTHTLARTHTRPGPLYTTITHFDARRSCCIGSEPNDEEVRSTLDPGHDWYGAV